MILKPSLLETLTLLAAAHAALVLPALLLAQSMTGCKLLRAA